MYKLIGNFRTRTQRVIWALMELGVDFEHVEVAPHSPEAKEANPSGKVPSLYVGDEVLTDSGAILMYLCDQHEALGFKSGTVERAHQDAHMLSAIDEIDGPLWALARAQMRAKGELPELRDHVFKIMERGFRLSVRRVGDGPFLMGETFTVADIYTAHCLAWARSFRIEMPDELTEYYRRCYARPAAQEMRAKYA